jgi:hypothetical protein
MSKLEQLWTEETEWPSWETREKAKSSDPNTTLREHLHKEEEEPTDRLN